MAKLETAKKSNNITCKVKIGPPLSLDYGEHWQSKDQEAIESFTIITTSANSYIEESSYDRDT